MHKMTREFKDAKAPVPAVDIEAYNVAGVSTYGFYSSKTANYWMANTAKFPIKDDNGVVWPSSELYFQGNKLGTDDPVAQRYGEAIRWFGSQNEGNILYGQPPPEWLHECGLEGILTESASGIQRAGKKVMEAIFRTYGYPESFKDSNGKFDPQLMSQHFKDWDGSKDTNGNPNLDGKSHAVMRQALQYKCDQYPQIKDAYRAMPMDSRPCEAFPEGKGWADGMWADNADGTGHDCLGMLHNELQAKVHFEEDNGLALASVSQELNALYNENPTNFARVNYLGTKESGIDIGVEHKGYKQARSEANAALQEQGKKGKDVYSFDKVKGTAMTMDPKGYAEVSYKAADMANSVLTKPLVKLTKISSPDVVTAVVPKPLPQAQGTDSRSEKSTDKLLSMVAQSKPSSSPTDPAPVNTVIHRPN